LTEPEYRRPTSWLSLGLLSGAVLAGTETALAAATGYNLPAWYFLAVLLCDLAGGVVMAFVAGALARALRLPGHGFAGAFAPLATAIAFVYALDKAGLAAVVRARPAWWGVVPLVPIALAGCAVAYRILVRASHTRAPDLSVVVSASLVIAAMVTARYVTHLMFPSLRAVGPMAAAAALMMVAALGVLAQDRWLAWPGRRPPPALPVGLVLVALAAGGTLVGWMRSRAPVLVPGKARSRLAAGARPNIVLVVIDTLRADRVSAYGYPRATTPNLSRLADEGVLFRNVIAPGNWTPPSTASLLTGTFPVTHGAIQADQAGLHPANATLAEILSDAGYRTGAVVSNSTALGFASGFDQGFAFYDARPNGRFGYEPMLNGFLIAFPLAFAGDLTPWRPATEVNRIAFEWLDENEDAPFFLFLNYMEPHEPYAPPAPFADRYPGRRILMAPRSGEIMRDRRDLTPEEEAHFRSMYDGEVACADASLGTLLDHLRRIGVYEDTLVVVTSDHGEFFGEHRLMTHTIGPYEEVHRVPLVIRYPRSRVRGIENAYVQLVDVLPTVLQVAGLPVPEIVQGRALPNVGHPILIEGAVNRRLVGFFGKRFDRSYQGIYAGGWKLVSNSDGTNELFDLGADPAETRDLAGARPEHVAELARTMSAYRESLPRLTRAFIDAEARRRLQGAGYLP
jgi:arylsulfatase A-like enzyme